LIESSFSSFNRIIDPLPADACYVSAPLHHVSHRACYFFANARALNSFLQLVFQITDFVGQVCPRFLAGFRCEQNANGRAGKQVEQFVADVDRHDGCSFPLRSLVHIADSVVRSLDFGVLVFHNRKNIRRKILFLNPFVVFQCGILTAFTLCNDRVITSSGNDRFDIDPPAMKCGGNAAAILRRSSKLPNFGLELRSKLGSLLRTLIEESAEVRVFDVFGSCLETVLAIPAGLDQVVETLNEFFTINSHELPPNLIFAIALP
jgi:hypothetical protein